MAERRLIPAAENRLRWRWNSKPTQTHSIPSSHPPKPHLTDQIPKTSTNNPRYVKTLPSPSKDPQAKNSFHGPQIRDRGLGMRVFSPTRSIFQNPKIHLAAKKSSCQDLPSRISDPRWESWHGIFFHG